MATLPATGAASPLNADDATRYVGFAVDTDNQTATFALNDMPGDFVTMLAGLTWTYNGNENITGGDDNLTLQICIRNAGGNLVLAGASSTYGSRFTNVYAKPAGGFSTTDVTRGPTAFSFVDTTATTATWNAALVEFRFLWSKSKGADGVRPQMDYVVFNGTYTAGTVTVNGVANVAGVGSVASSSDVTVYSVADVAGVGAFASSSGVFPVQVNVIADLAGAGAVASSSAVTVYGAADVAGVGAVDSATVVGHKIVADLSGVGAIASASNIVVYVVADLPAPGVVFASATITSSVISGVADLSGAGVVASSSTVTVYAVSNVAGSGTIDSVVSTGSAFSAFSTPTYDGVHLPAREKQLVDMGHVSGLRLYARMGGVPQAYSVLIVGGVASPFPGVVTPTRAQVDAADRFFQGGLKHTVTLAEQTILETAGYTVG